MSNKKLLGFLLLLIIIVAFVFWKETNSVERNFKKDIISINTESIEKILIYPKSYKPEIIELIKNDTLWFINRKDSGMVEANQNLLNGILELLNFTAERPAATTKESWGNYLVDENSATKVEVLENNTNNTVFYVGKFSYNQETNAVTSYIRIPNDDNTYAIDGQHSLIFDQNTSGFIKQED